MSKGWLKLHQFLTIIAGFYDNDIYDSIVWFPESHLFIPKPVLCVCL